MIIKILIVVFALVVLALLVVASRNVKKQRIVTEEPSFKCFDIIGDGACPWTATRAEYPKAARVREFEPRGM